MALTTAQRVEVGRHLGYPMIGGPAVTSGGPPYTSTFGQAGGLLGFRYFEFYPLLLFRLANMSTNEEVSIVGSSSSFFGSFYTAANASVTITAAAPASGDNVTVQINGQPSSYTFAVSDTQATIAAGLASSINTNTALAGLVIAQNAGAAVAINARVIGARANSLSIASYVQGVSATVAVTYASAPTNTLQGGQDPPGPVWIDPSEQITQPYYGYLPIIRFWETQLTNSASGMDTIKADVFSQRQDELAARYGGYLTWCKRLAQFISVPYMGAGNYMGTQGSRRMA